MAHTDFDVANTQPWSSLTTVTLDGKIITQQEIFDSLAQQLKEFDTQNTHPYTELDISEDPNGKPTAVQATLDPAVQATVTPEVAALSAAASIGQVLGSAIGHALAPKDPFLALAAGTVAGAIGQQLSQAIAQGGLSFDGASLSIAGVFQGFNVSLENAASGAVASFLTAEIGTALGLHGFGAQLFDAAVGGYAGSVLQQALQIGLGNTDQAINWSVALSGSEINISGAIGSLLAHQLVTAHTQDGAIGGQLVGAIGSIIGLSIGKVLGMSLDFILPGVGSLIGTILGTWLGDAFAPDPAQPFANSTVDPSTYSYGGHVFFVGGGGNSAVSNAMADTTSSVVNAYLTAVGGVALASSKQVHIGYQADLSATPYFWTEPGTVFNGRVQQIPHYDTTADAIINAASLYLLHNTEAVGGDLLMKRAHQHSQYSDTETLAGDLQVAQDYELYLNNREAINALIAVNPNTAFTAGWVDTFVRVNDLGLNHYSASDFLGGMVTGYLDSVKKAGLAFDPSGVSVKHGSDGSITIDIRVGGNVDVPGVLSAFADHSNEIDDATGKTIQLVFADGLATGGFHGPASASLVSGVWTVTGSAGNNIWIGRDDVPNSFQAASGSYNILLGGALADIIHAGNNGDYVDGGAGNDQIFGGTGNDILRGGPGNDILQGGAGNDSYQFARGDGADTVFDTGGTDTLALGPGIRLSDIQVQHSGNDLIVGVKDPANPNATFAQLTDKITLQSWWTPQDRIETFRFDDGTVLDLSGGGIDIVTGATLAGGSVAENSVNGTAVGTVVGADLDLAAVLHYQLIDNAGGRFAINPSTGAITVANGSLLDYETATSHVIGVRVTDQSGHSLDQTFNLDVTNVNDAPVLTVPSANVAASAGQALQVSSLFSATDADHDALTYYLYDYTVATSGGHFALNGAALPNDTMNAVTAAQLAQTTFVAGAAGASDDLYVKVFDGQVYTDWSEFHVNVNHAPVVTVPSANVVANAGQVLTASSLFSATDADGDTLSYYVYDDDAAANGGHWVVNGTVVPSQFVYAVSAAQLAQTTFVAGASGTSDELRVIAYDGQTYSNNSVFTYLHVDVTNSNASTTIYDASDVYAWNSFRSDADASNNVTFQLGINNGGGSWQNEYDVAGNQSWSTRMTVTNAAGQLVSQTVNNDDGTHVLVANDVSQSYSWSTFTMQFDTNWNYVSVSGTNDDGSHNLDLNAVWNSFDTLLWYSNPYVVTPAPPGGGDDGLPVILDLDGNGVSITPLASSTASFDMDGQPGKEHTAWVSGGDGILAIDLGPGGAAGPDGVIDQTSEIVFSNWAPGATSDMDALRAIFDTNHNGELDPGDSRWAEFRIWQDANGDGVSDSGELRTLDAAGIASIGLEPVEPSQILGDGSAVSGLSNFTWKDGHVGTAADVSLAYQHAAAGSVNAAPVPAFGFADDAKFVAPAGATGQGMESFSEQGVPTAVFGRSAPANGASPSPQDIAGPDDAFGSVIGHDIIANADLLAKVGYGWHVA